MPEEIKSRPPDAIADYLLRSPEEETPSSTSSKKAGPTRIHIFFPFGNA